MNELTVLMTFAAGLGMALVLGFAAKRLHVSPIVGYLLAGIAVGPIHGRLRRGPACRRSVRRDRGDPPLVRGGAEVSPGRALGRLAHRHPRRLVPERDLHLRAGRSAPLDGMGLFLRHRARNFHLGRQHGRDGARARRAARSARTNRSHRDRLDGRRRPAHRHGAFTLADVCRPGCRGRCRHCARPRVGSAQDRRARGARRSCSENG